MATKYVLAALAVVFLGLSLARRAGSGRSPQVRTWLLIGAIFGAVSAWLFYQGF